MMENLTDIQLLETWKEALQGDLDLVQGKIDVELEKKHEKEAKLTKQLHPILARIAKHQRRVDDIKVKMNEIDNNIAKLKDENQNQEDNKEENQP